MNIVDSLKNIVKRQIKRVDAPRPLSEFTVATLPWIDKPGADIDAFVAGYKPDKRPAYDMAEKLRFWQTNGYVILENAIQTHWLHQLWSEVEELIQHPSQYTTNVRVDRPEFSANPVLPVQALPKEILDGPYIKFMDFHDNSVIGKKIMLHSNIVSFLEAVFDEKVVAMQSLLFKYGSQQATHQDFPYVVSEIPSHLAASWIALEDVKIDSGPLYYYPGSHQIKKFDFGNTGIVFNGQSKYDPNDFANYLDKTCEKLSLSRKTLLIKKGDVLLWHAALAHGGEAILNPQQTRKSFVCHYSSGNAYKHHRQSPDAEPVRRTINGADVFANPLMPEQEDIFRAGEQM